MDKPRQYQNTDFAIKHLITALIATIIIQIPGFADNDLAWKQLMNDAVIASNRGNTVHAVELLEKALEQAQLFGAEDQHVSRTLQELGNEYAKQGKFDVAESSLRRALAIDEKIAGPTSLAVSSDLNTLAILLNNQAHYNEAIDMFKRALEIKRGYQTGDEQNVAILANLGTCYLSVGQYDLAESTLTKAIDLRRKSLGPADESMIHMLNSIGGVYEKKNRFNEAEAAYKESLTLRETAFGPNNPKIITTLSNLGSLYLHLKRPVDAEKMFIRALNILKSFPDGHDLELSMVYGNLGVAYTDEKKYQEAKEALDKALVLRERLLGAEHPQTGIVLANLGNLAIAQGNTKEAQEYFQKALLIIEKTKGPNHPDTVSVRNLLSRASDPNYFTDSPFGKIHASTDQEKAILSSLSEAHLAEKSGNLQLAETHYKKALPLMEKHPAINKNIAPIYVHYAVLEQKLNHLNEAEVYFKKGLAQAAQCPSSAKPIVLSGAYSGLGAVYFAQHNLPLCEQFCRKAVKIDGENSSIPLPIRVVNLSNLATLLMNQHRYAEAAPLMKKAHDQSMATLGQYHPTTIGISTSYKILQMKMAQPLKNTSRI